MFTKLLVEGSRIQKLIVRFLVVPKNPFDYSSVRCLSDIKVSNEEGNRMLIIRWVPKFGHVEVGYYEQEAIYQFVARQAFGEIIVK